MKLLITVQENDIAPRFDQTTEIIIADYTRTRLKGQPRHIILPRKSSEDLCDLIVKEGISCVICGGLEDNFHKFFIWKKINVIDSVIGSYAEAMSKAKNGRLASGLILPSARNSD